MQLRVTKLSTPVEMSFSDYYSYYISKIKLEMFEQYKVDNRLQESETRQYYESHKELFSQGDEISLWFIQCRMQRTAMGRAR